MDNFFLTTRCLILKQRICLEKFRDLNFRIGQRELNSRLTLKGQKDQFATHHYMQRFDSIYLKLLNLFKEIRAYNSFWTLYLTTYFVVYVVELCFLTYCYIFFMEFMDIFFMGFSLFLVLYFLFTLSLMLFECSLIVHYNVLTHKEITRFGKMYQASSAVSLTHRLKV